MIVKVKISFEKIRCYETESTKYQILQDQTPKESNNTTIEDQKPLTGIRLH